MAETRALKNRLWLRLYTNLPDQFKVQRLSGDVFKFWVNCLCLAGRSDGYLPSIDDIGFYLRMPAASVTKMLTFLQDPIYPLIDQVEAGRFRMHDWGTWQYEADNSKDRTAAYRERIRKAGRPINGYLKHRDLVHERDGYRCVYCGSDFGLCLDHVVPIILGGDDEPGNLATACRTCNCGKSGRTPQQAGMTIRKDSPYFPLYGPNMERLHAFYERRATPRVTVTNEGAAASVTVTHSQIYKNVTVTPSAYSVSDSVSEKEECERKTNFDLAAWFEVIYLRHPKKSAKVLAEHAAFTILERCREAGNEPAQVFAEIERVHELWCKTEDWRKSRGQFCPKLGLWLEDEGFRIEPGAEEVPLTGKALELRRYLDANPE